MDGTPWTLVRSLVAILPLVALQTAPAAAQERSFDRLVTGNGHAVASYSRTDRRVDTFLEHPYRFFTPRNMPEDLCYEADESRDLAHDVYFGVRSGSGDDSRGEWLSEVPLDRASYIVGTNIIEAEQRVGVDRQLRVRTRTWMPMGVELPVLVMTAEVTNEGEAPIEVSIYDLVNLRLGDASGGREPSPNAEEVAWDDERGVFYEYSDASAGTAAVVPLSGYRRRTVSGGDNSVYNRLRAGAELDDTFATSGPRNDVAIGVENGTVMLAPGGSTEDAFAIVWALDEDAGPKVDAVVAWADRRTPTQLWQDEASAWEEWIGDPPSGLTDDQELLWRQSNAILRMGQVREPGTGFGAILASLPPGLGFVDAQWNIAWVRDMAYAVLGLLRAGHLEEAEAALRFQIEAGPGRRTAEVGGPYRISATRYFGDGQEETDCNADGPNIEFDGFGLYLWTLGEYLRSGGDLETVREWWPEIRDGVADVLVNLVDDEGIVAADSSIWEVHWNGRQKRFTYTSLAAVRGLCDAAMIAERLGEEDESERYARIGTEIQHALAELHTDERGTLAQSREDLDRGFEYIDAAAIEAVNWGVVAPDGRIARATITSMLENLTVETGIGLMRNDDGGWYDSQEWVFVDLRLLPSLRAAGFDERADALLEWVQDQALANDLQFSELHTADEGRYAGSIPMVGFGAGAYLAALEGSVNEAACGAYAEEDEPGEDAGPGDGGTDAGTDAGSDAGRDAGTDAGTDSSVPDAGTGDSGVDSSTGDAGFCFGDECDDDGCSCVAAGASNRGAPLGWLAVLMGAWVWRRVR